MKKITIQSVAKQLAAKGYSIAPAAYDLASMTARYSVTGCDSIAKVMTADEVKSLIRNL